jgi:hypothetical protein
MKTPLWSESSRAMRGHAITISPGQMTMQFGDDHMRMHGLDARKAREHADDRPALAVRLLQWMIG